MNWFKIEVAKGNDTYHWVGSCSETIEQLSDKASRGDFIQLNEILYMDRGEVKEWAEWDASLIPTVAINPRTVVSIIQFKGDPRKTPRR